MYRKRIAVDLAKDVFQITESARPGEVTLRKRLSRVAFVRYLQAIPEPALIIMEACGTAHYWARFARVLGHDISLLHARYVKPYRQRNKTDRNETAQEIRQITIDRANHFLQGLAIWLISTSEEVTVRQKNKGTPTPC